MFKYILKRILIFIPTLIAISLGTFVLSLNAPGDPVELMLNQSGGGQDKAADKIAGEEAYNQKRKELNLDLPVFYFAASNMAACDTLHRVSKQKYRENLGRLINSYGNWPEIQQLYLKNRTLDFSAYDVERDSTNADALIKIKDLTAELLTSYKDSKIENLYGRLETQTAKSASLAPIAAKVAESKAAYLNVKNNASTWKSYVPSLSWYGFENQYHKWVTKFLKGDFGKSYLDGRSVGTKIKEGVFWTMFMSIIAMIITYLVAIPLGIYSAVNKGGFFDQISTTALFILYSLPSFWIATLMVVFLTGGDYLDLFPTYGVGEGINTPFDYFKSASNFGKLNHLILPMICWTYGSFAYLSRQMRGGMLTVVGQDFIRTAKAKGLAEKVVVLKHALRNALLPIITLFASVFPRAIGGSVILEVIFNLPGMGFLSFNAIVARDYPIVFAVFMFSAILTLVGYLVADVLYAVVDPRISYNK